jgi:nucleotide-binding universal stress UspA family protein
MYKKILIPTDGSSLAQLAVEKGVELAKALDASIVVLTVLEPFEVMRHFATADHERLTEAFSTYHREAGAHAKGVLNAAAAMAAEAGVPAETLQLESGHPFEAIIKAATEHAADLIVMSSHGRKGMAALMIGSETTKVLTHSKIPVLVLR